MSLRLKIVGTIAVAVIVAVLTCGLVIRQNVAALENDRLRESAAEQLADAVNIYNDTGVLALNAAVDDPALPEAARAAALDGSAVTIVAEADGRDWMFAATAVSVGDFEAVMSVRSNMQSSAELLDRIDQAVVFGVLISGILVVLLASIIAGQMARRISLGAAAARKIAAGNTSVRITDAISSGEDEVADFANAVDSAVQRLQERLDSEQRFTADLAHEMRTPLTGLINAAALLEDSRPAELVRDRVQRLQVLVEDLLEVSRLDTGHVEAQLSKIGVDQTVRSVITRLSDGGPLAEHDVQFYPGAPGAVMTTDQRRFERIITNLLVNAAKHGTDPIVVLTDPESITVSDSGPGYPKDILANGPSRFVSSGGGGMGLGLVIAQGQARVLGMTLLLGSTPMGGAAAKVLLGSGAEADSER